MSRALEDLGAGAPRVELLERLISLHGLLYPGQGAARRRRDATHFPRYMLVQDSCYRGKDTMPFWVWVKRETIQPAAPEQLNRVPEILFREHRRKVRSTSGVAGDTD